MLCTSRNMSAIGAVTVAKESHPHVQLRLKLTKTGMLRTVRIIGRYVRILTNINQILTKNTKNDKNMSFSKRACQKKKKNACGSGPRSKHGLGLPILTKYRRILINIGLLSISIN